MLNQLTNYLILICIQRHLAQDHFCLTVAELPPIETSPSEHSYLTLLRRLMVFAYYAILLAIVVDWDDPVPQTIHGAWLQPSLASWLFTAVLRRLRWDIPWLRMAKF